MRLRPALAAILLATLPASLGLAGCTEYDETLAFESDGGGTWSCSVRWDAALLARVTGIVGGDVLRRLEGRAFPLREDQIRASLDGVEGVAIEEVADVAGEGGVREVRVRLRFRRFADLVAWEVFARRAVSVTHREDGSLRLDMDPLADVPLFGALAALARAAESDAGPGGDPGESSRDPGPLGRIGVRPEDADLLRSLLRPRLERVRFSFRVRVPGEVHPGGAAGAGEDPHVGGVEIPFADLGRAAGAGRGPPVRVAWRPLTLDVAPLLDHPGDAPSPFPPP